MCISTVGDGYWCPRLSKRCQEGHKQIRRLTFHGRQDPLLKRIADGSNVAVISIGYRLAPENPFPKGPEDCFDALEWLVDNAHAKFGAELRFLGGEVSSLAIEDAPVKRAD